MEVNRNRRLSQENIASKNNRLASDVIVEADDSPNETPLNNQYVNPSPILYNSRTAKDLAPSIN